MQSASSVELDTRAVTCGTGALEALASTAWKAIEGCDPGCLRLGRLRGRGRDASFSQIVRVLNGSFGIEPKAPFEGSERVGGAVFPLVEVGGERVGTTVLRWEFGARDLPLHSHDHSDRFIVVVEGRGFFHWSEGNASNAKRREVQTTAARRSDVFAFSRGLNHTFSTFDSAMTLLSVHLPFIEFADARQYTVAEPRWTPETDTDFINARAGIDWVQ